MKIRVEKTIRGLPAEVLESSELHDRFGVPSQTHGWETDPLTGTWQVSWFEEVEYVL